jgi:hypothetical protein
MLGFPDCNGWPPLASTTIAIQIGPATSAKTSTVLIAQRTDWQGEYNLFAKQRRQVYMLATIVRKFQILDSRVPIRCPADRCRRDNETEVALCDGMKCLGAPPTHTLRGRAQHAFENQVYTGPIVRKPDRDRSVQSIILNRTASEQAVDLVFRFAKSDMLHLTGDVFDSQFHGCNLVGVGILARGRPARA